MGTPEEARPRREPTPRENLQANPLYAGTDIRLPPAPASVARARRELEEDDLPEDLLHDARLVLGELVTNSLRHSDLRPDQWIGVRTQRRQGCLRIEVCDPGPGFPPPPPLPRSSGRFGGRGLLIVDRLASRWGAGRTPDGRWEVWAELDRKPAT